MRSTEELRPKLGEKLKGLKSNKVKQLKELLQKPISNLTYLMVLMKTHPMMIAL